jgi:hypothetical protein
LQALLLQPERAVSHVRTGAWHLARRGDFALQLAARPENKAKLIVSILADIEVRFFPRRCFSMTGYERPLQLVRVRNRDKQGERRLLPETIPQ